MQALQRYRNKIASKTPKWNIIFEELKGKSVLGVSTMASLVLLKKIKKGDLFGVYAAGVIVRADSEVESPNVPWANSIHNSKNVYVMGLIGGFYINAACLVREIPRKDPSLFLSHANTRPVLCMDERGILRFARRVAASEDPLRLTINYGPNFWSQILKLGNFPAMSYKDQQATMKRIRVLVPDDFSKLSRKQRGDFFAFWKDFEETEAKDAKNLVQREKREKRNRADAKNLVHRKKRSRADQEYAATSNKKTKRDHLFETELGRIFKLAKDAETDLAEYVKRQQKEQNVL
jgi:hypothetical protein